MGAIDYRISGFTKLKDFKNLQPNRIYHFENKFIVTNGSMLLYRKPKQNTWSLMTKDKLLKWGEKIVRATDDFEYDIR